jgi:hypothetical protein
VRRFYVRRKDLSAFPFQFTFDREGVQQLLEKGDTYTYSILPPKDEFSFLHVHVLEDFIRAADAQWELPRSEMIRVAAAAMQAWLSGEIVPDDHFNGVDMLKVDQAWYPRDSTGEPRLASNPYDFEVILDEPWPTDELWARKTSPDNSVPAA